MKRNLAGDDAFSQMISTTVPDKTDSYTPIPHSGVIKHLRNEIRKAGFVIIGEDYRCNASAKYRGVMNEGGTVGLALMKIQFVDDPELVLIATFLNSYNKSYAFRFALGAQIKTSGNTILLENDIHGFARYIHTGKNDAMAEGTISELVQNAKPYWESLLQFKNDLAAIDLTTTQIHDLLGEMYISQDLLSSFQFNIICKELREYREKKKSRGDNPDIVNAWKLYDIVAEGLKETHPAEWMELHSTVQRLFAQMVLGETADLPGAEEEETNPATTSPAFGATAAVPDPKPLIPMTPVATIPIGDPTPAAPIVSASKFQP